MINPVNELKKLLKERTQTDLAREMGISEGYLSLVLSGTREAGPAITKYLGLEKKVTETVVYYRVKS